MNFDKLKNFMDYMAAERTPANAAEVYLNGKSVFKYAAGFSDLERKKPLTGEEYFNIYSCSKITTVTAAIQLLEQGKFLLADPLGEYIPEYKTMYVKQADGTVKEAQKPITIGDLFSMTAGLTYNFETDAFRKARKLTDGKMDTVAVVKCLAEDPLDFEPGTRWQYSLCHDVLAGLVSVVSGMKFRDYVKKNIFGPLEMTQSFYHADEQILNNMAEQYSYVPEGADANFDIVEAQKHGAVGGGTFVNVGKDVSHILGEEYDSGGAGIITTVADYSKLAAALANYGEGLNGARILSKYSVELMRTHRLNEEQHKSFDWKHLAGYGYGLGVRTHMDKAKSGSVSNVGEFGWGGAAGASVVVDPEINLAVFYVQHCLNPREEGYQPRLKNVVYSCL